MPPLNQAGAVSDYYVGLGNSILNVQRLIRQFPFHVRFLQKIYKDCNLLPREIRFPLFDERHHTFFEVWARRTIRKALRFRL